MATLQGMIIKYEDMLRTLPPEEIQEDQRERVNLLRAQESITTSKLVGFNKGKVEVSKRFKLEQQEI